MVFDFEVDGEPVKVSLERSECGKFRAQIGEASYLIDAANGHLLLDSGDGGPRRSREFSAWLESNQSVVFLAGRRMKVVQPNRRRGASKGSSSGRVKAPMNGQVVKILKKVGDTVDSGEVVLTLEAMKMENEVAAPCAGVLSRLEVKPGQNVEPGSDLFLVKPGDDADV